MVTDLSIFFSSPCPSPQLRMSFIVFSTEGRILMSLTEDRWVQIPSKTAFNPLLFYHSAKGNECNTRFGHRSHTVLITLNFYDQEEIPDRYFPSLWSVYGVVGLDNYFLMSFLTHRGQLMCLIFPQQCLSSTVSLLPSYLILQRAHFLSICVIVSWANTHQYCFNLFICYTLLVFSANPALVETIILLPRLVVSGFSQKYVLKWIWQNKYFQLV